MTPLRWAAAALVVLSLVFAVQAGEFSTWDWLTLRHEVRAEREAVARLQAEIDSLETMARTVERDPAEQERIAREEYGMIRRGEFLYRLVDSQTAGR